MKKPFSSLAGKMAEFSLDRRVTVFVILITIMVVGYIATLGIPRDLFPRGYESKFLHVVVPWRNAPAQEILERITRPLEAELSTIKDLVDLSSMSSQDSSRVNLQFKRNVDIDVAYREVRDRVERARLRFPDDVDQVFIRREDPDSIPVAVLGLAIDPSITDPYTLVEKKIMLPLKRMDGVANVISDGIVEKEIIIDLDKQKTDAHGLNIYQMSQNLARDNFTLASGNVRQGGREYLLRSIATYRTPDELKSRPITEWLQLNHIAKLSLTEPERDFVVRVNGNPAVAVIIFKEGDANTVEVCEQVSAEVERMKVDPLFEGIQMELFFNQGRIIQSSIGNLITGGQIGGALAAVVLLIFLKRFRMTLIVTASIPLSLLISLTVMYFTGESLNMITILGLVICVGLLVDNSIVVAENIYRYLQDGHPVRRAAVQGAGEIALAITMATLTTVIVFLPVALVEGEGQFFLIRLALPISVSLIASLFVALMFIPLSACITLRSRQDSAPLRTGALNRALDAIYRRTVIPLGRFYHGTLAVFLKNRLDLFLLTAAVFSVTFGWVAPQLDIVPNQEEDRMSFQIGVKMPNNSNIKDTGKLFDQLEAVMKKESEELKLEGFMFVHYERGGRVDGWLDPDRDYELSGREMMDRIIKAFPQPPGVKYQTGRESQVQEAKGRTVFTVKLEGEDSDQLQDLAEKLEPRFLAVPGIIGIRTGNERPPNELALQIDRERSTDANVNPEYISGVVGYALRGRRLSRFHFDDREIPVTVRYAEEDRDTLDSLANFLVPTMDGDYLPVSALTSVQKIQTARGIFRSNKKTTHTLTLDLKADDAGKTRQSLTELQQSIDLPEGVSFGRQFGDLTFNQELASLQFAAGLSVVFIYLLMGILFESFILPLSIILTIPLASIGVVWIHYLTGKDLDMLGFVGAILLIGVVVNNGIVLVDYINRLRQQGMERTAAVLQATDRRFRPILMTALTTIIGMIPLTISKPTEIGLSYKSFGLTLIGGMAAATLLTLLIVPVFYTLFDDLRQCLSRTVRRWL